VGADGPGRGDRAVAAAQTHGVMVHAGPRFGADPGTFERYVRLPYVQPPELLREASGGSPWPARYRAPARGDHRSDSWPDTLHQLLIK